MTTLEITRFTVDPASVPAMMAARQALAGAIAEHCPGFQGLQLARLDERTWVDVVQWESPEAARAAEKAVMQLPECQAMFVLIEQVVSMEHGEMLQLVSA